jgi:hypothetical protein
VPIPDDHLQRLEADLSAREGWLRTLRRQIATLEDEASAHEMILALGRDPDLLHVLHELHDHPELGQRIAEEPRSFFEERGVRVPEGATVTATSDQESTTIEARFVTQSLQYGGGWSRRDGFYIVQAGGIAVDGGAASDR